jgi:hypothetical protein
VTYLETGKTKQIKLLHSDHWKVFEGNPGTMTRPLLGCNLYAEDRTKPTVPWKPIQGQKEDKQVEEQKAAEKDKEEKNKKPEEAQEQSQTSTEFNLLANLIC